MNERNRYMRVGIISVTVGALYILAAINGFSQQDAARRIVLQAAQAYGERFSDGSITNWSGSGTITITGDEKGPSDFTIMVKGSMVQRTVTRPSGSKMRYGSDGKKCWQTAGLLSGEAAGRAKYFIESQTTRSMAALFANAAKGDNFADLGLTKDGASRIIEARNAEGQTTRYYIDNATSLITRLEFDTGAFYTMLFSEEKHPVFASFVFSDFRAIDGVMTPFTIETYQGLIKIEEMTFANVRYNSGVSDDVFVP